jgi:hypothetical protein
MLEDQSTKAEPHDGFRQPLVSYKGSDLPGYRHLPPFTVEVGVCTALSFRREVLREALDALNLLLSKEERTSILELRCVRPLIVGKIVREASPYRFGFFPLQIDDFLIRHFSISPAEARKCLTEVDYPKSAKNWNELPGTPKVRLAIAAASRVSKCIVYDDFGIDPSGVAAVEKDISILLQQGYGAIRITSS